MYSRAGRVARRLHAAICDLAEDAREVLADPEGARALEQALIEAMMQCLGGEVHEDSATLRHHAAIMRRFHRVIDPLDAEFAIK